VAKATATATKSGAELEGINAERRRAIRVRTFGLFHDPRVLTDADLAVIADQHRALVRALAAGDPDQAAHP
jgi:DNA-binding GntR family transcriptional regulator